MANLELEPYFVKAIRLLHSKSKDSSEQLKAMLDDSLALRYSGSIKDSKSLSVSIKQESEIRVKKASPKSEISKNFFEDIRKKDPEKRPLEKIKLDPGLLSDGGNSSSSKRARLESPSSSSSSSSPRSIKQDDIIIKAEDSELIDLVEEHNADDVALEMGLACAVCKQVEVSPGNQMIECLECHKLYHQECHQPPATDQDVLDPRTVWYCSRCHKNLKRMQATKNQKVKSNIVPLSTIAKDPPPPLLRPTPKTEQVAPLPFKRTEIKVPSSQGSSPNNSNSSSSSSLASNKPVGLAGLAANLSGSRTTPQTQQQPQPQSAKTKLPTYSAFPSLKAGLEAAAAANSSTSITKTSSTSFGTSGLASLASVAAAVSKSTIPRSLSSGSSMISPIISSSSSSGNGSKLSSSTSSMMSADKRLQIMKKKAAAKMQEKRRLPK